MDNQLIARARPGDADGSHEVLSPAVGRYGAAPPVGTFLSPGAVAGRIRVLRRDYRVVVPQGVSGVVAEVRAPGRVTRVEYGQPLLVLAKGFDGVGAGVEAGAGAGRAADEEVPEGMLAARAPTDGIFYRRPSPDQPEYVAAGELVVRGTVLGLVEVMKCFNQISWADPEHERATVARILVEDAAEVKLGQVLVLLEPA